MVETQNGAKESSVISFQERVGSKIRQPGTPPPFSGRTGDVLTFTGSLHRPEAKKITPEFIPGLSLKHIPINLPQNIASFALNSYFLDQDQIHNLIYTDALPEVVDVFSDTVNTYLSPIERGKHIAGMKKKVAEMVSAAVFTEDHEQPELSDPRIRRQFSTEAYQGAAVGVLAAIAHLRLKARSLVGDENRKQIFSATQKEILGIVNDYRRTDLTWMTRMKYALVDDAAFRFKQAAEDLVFAPQFVPSPSLLTP